VTDDVDKNKTDSKSRQTIIADYLQQKC